MIHNASGWSPLEGRGHGALGVQGAGHTSGWLPINRSTMGPRGGTGCKSYLLVAAYQQVWDGTAGGWHRRRQRARQPRQGACGTVSSAAAPQCQMQPLHHADAHNLLLLPASQRWAHVSVATLKGGSMSCHRDCNACCFGAAAQQLYWWMGNRLGNRLSSPCKDALLECLENHSVCLSGVNLMSNYQSCTCQ